MGNPPVPPSTSLLTLSVGLVRMCAAPRLPGAILWELRCFLTHFKPPQFSHQLVPCVFNGFCVFQPPLA